MILSFKELKKREVINIADGTSFGKITDMQLDFPCATLKSITVCDRRRSGLLCLFRKNEIYIDEKQIVRIGGDVILVDVKDCGAITPAVVDINAKSAQQNCDGRKKRPNRPPSPQPCPQPCPPPCPPRPAPCPPPIKPSPCQTENYDGETGGTDFSEDVRIDFEDY